MKNEKCINVYKANLEIYDSIIQYFKKVLQSQQNFPSNSNYDISLSIFEDLSQRSLFFSSSNIVVRIRSCYFFNISCIESSGTVHFNCKQSSIYHEKNCAISCNSKNHGHYTYSFVSEHQNYDNFVEQSTFLFSGDQTNKYGVVLLQGGHLKLKYNNFSRSTCETYGSFVIMAPTDVGIVSFCIIDSSISTGQKESYTCPTVDSRGIENVMNHSTIFNNTAQQSVIATAYDNSKFTVNDCNLIDNDAENLMLNEYPTTNSLTAYRLFIQNTSTTCVNAQLFETVEPKYEFDFNVLHLICESIPNYYVNLNICSVCNNNCIKGFSQYVLYLVFILL